jgi:hypothetical protein
MSLWGALPVLSLLVSFPLNLFAAGGDPAAMLDEIGAGTVGFQVKDLTELGHYIKLIPTLSRDAVLHGPDWTPGTPAPLSPQKAAAIARRALVNLAGESNIAACKVSDITLNALYGSNDKKWYYSIVFGVPCHFKDAYSGKSISVIRWFGTVDVTMDGTWGIGLSPY